MSGRRRMRVKAKDVKISTPEPKTTPKPKAKAKPRSKAKKKED